MTNNYHVKKIQPRHLQCFVVSLLFILLTMPTQILAYDNSLPQTTWSTTAFNSSLTNSAHSFLPVDEAYQLNAEITPQGSIRLSWIIAPGYYLYKHQLKALWQPNDTKAPLLLPKGITKYDEIFEKELEVYYHTLEFEIPRATAGTELIIGSQGCADAGLCYPPQTQHLKVSEHEVLLYSPPVNAAPANPNSELNSLSLLGALAAALIGGIILNLMPCVFPVLSLKALGLLQSKHTKHQQHMHGWAYTAGSILTFCLIAALMFSLRDAGQIIGWGFQLQSPWVVASLGYLFVLMALILIGDYPIATRLSGTGQKFTQGKGYSSSFFTGALATVVASPCTAPFMGAALGYAITQPTLIGLSIFASLGLGMALPFLLLSHYPNLSQKLPKPGPWMNTLKQFFAFPLLLTALWLFWVLGKQSGSDAVIAFIGGSILIAFSLWLWHTPPPSTIKKLMAIAAAAASLTPYMWANTNVEHQNTVLNHNWQPFTQQRLDQLITNNQPTFVNLTAAWCITCLANEKIALDTKKTIQAFEEAKITKLKGDWTNYNPEITELLNRFGRNGVPLYLLYSGKKGAQPYILPQLLTEEIIKEAISTKLN